MPLTPFHLGSGLFLGSLTLRFFNLWAILLGSIVMDIEPAVLLIIRKCYSCPHHAFFHSILGAIFGSLILAAILWKFREKLDNPAPWNIPFYLQKMGEIPHSKTDRVRNAFGNKGRDKISQSFSFPVLFCSSLAAWILHIFFDNLTHYDVFLFWPFHFKPFYLGPGVYWPLNFIFLIFGIFGFLLAYKKIKTPKNL